MLRQHLREALSMVKPGMRPQPEAGSPDSPALDTAADPRKLVQVDATPLKIHHTLWLGFGGGSRRRGRTGVGSGHGRTRRAKKRLIP